MKRHVLTLVAICTTLLAVAAYGLAPLGAGDSSPSKQIDRELQQFQGSWKAVSIQHVDGRQASKDEVQNTRLVVEGNKFRLAGKDGFRISGTFFINPTRNPNTIDVLLRSKDGRETRFLGIYQVQGGKRKSCFALPGKERPARFSFEKGYVAFEWRRDK